MHATEIFSSARHEGKSWLFAKFEGSKALNGQSMGRRGMTQLIAWMSGALKSDLGVAILAERAGMSERTFLRAFKRNVGMSPAAFVRTLRVERACSWLEETNLPLKKIATEAGFGSEDTLIRAFRVELGISPAVFRARFHR